VSLALSESAAVRVSLQRRTASGWRTVRKLSATLGAGSGKVVVSKAVSRKLRSGRYRAVVTATDQDGNRSATKRATFRVSR